MDRDVNEIDEFMEDLANLTDVSDYLSSSDSEGRKEERLIKKSRLIPFYKTRKDILTYFCEEKLMRTFRFDRVSIEYITGF